MGVELIEGRLFTDGESGGTLPVIVDDLLAGRLWPDGSALGQPLLLGQAQPDSPAFIVGVVRPLRLRSLVADLLPQVFVPYPLWLRSPMAYVVRTTGDPAALAPQVREAVAGLDPRLPIYDVRPMRAYVDDAMAVRRALGAGAPEVMREVLREGLRFAVVSAGLGLLGSAVVAQLLRSQLYAVEPRDAATFLTGLALILVGVVLACWIPARRATAISPMDALRTE